MSIRPYRERHTAKQIRASLSYDGETGVFKWIVAKKGRRGPVAGSQRSDGYRQIQVDGCVYYEHRLAWLHVYGQWPGMKIDHKNRETSDNRISNLRVASNPMNEGNKVLRSNSTSGHTGVGWHKKSRKWRAHITIKQEHRHLGFFARIEDAIEVRERAAIAYFGEYRSIEEE